MQLAEASPPGDGYDEAREANPLRHHWLLLPHWITSNQPFLKAGQVQRAQEVLVALQYHLPEAQHHTEKHSQSLVRK